MLDASGYKNKDESYHDEYHKDKDVSCIINNINNIGTGSNATDGLGNIPEPGTCEECFNEFLIPNQITTLLAHENFKFIRIVYFCLLGQLCKRI